LKRAGPASQWFRLTTGYETTFTAPSWRKIRLRRCLNAWQRYVFRKDSSFDLHAYTFCMLDQLVTALHRRDVFTKPSCAMLTRANLLGESELETMRPVVCRTLGLSAQPQPVLDALRAELDRTYREIAQRLPNNHAVRFEKINGKEELILSPLEKLEEPVSLVKLREAVVARLPRVDIPEIVVEIAARTGFAEAFTHFTERTARVTDLTTSVCAVLTAEACNTGPEPFIRYDNPALRQDRLAWVKQNYVRDDTFTAANAKLVSPQNRIALAHVWGGGEVASADGNALPRSEPHCSCRSQSKLLRPAQRRDLVQLALRSIHRTQRDPDPRHSA
jgi:hypothetical protein